MHVGSLQFPLGVHAAAVVRVGNALGAADTATAQVTSKVVLVLTGVTSVIPHLNMDLYDGTNSTSTFYHIFVICTVLHFLLQQRSLCSRVPPSLAVSPT